VFVTAQAKLFYDQVARYCTATEDRRVDVKEELTNSQPKTLIEFFQPNAFFQPTEVVVEEFMARRSQARQKLEEGVDGTGISPVYTD